MQKTAVNLTLLRLEIVFSLSLPHFLFTFSLQPPPAPAAPSAASAHTP